MRALILLSVPAVLAAQTAGPAITVDVQSGRKPISPLVYSINDYDQDGNSLALSRELRIPLSRWGGDHTSSYAWDIDAVNSASDWYFTSWAYEDSEVATLPDGSHFDHLMEQYRGYGTLMLSTVPILDWTPKSRDSMCSYSIRKYGPQKESNPWVADCGNGVDLQGNDIRNDPNDAYRQKDEVYVAAWISHLTGKYGTARQGGVQIYALDNEPVWWSGVHRDIHPGYMTYDELLSRGIRYAAAVKSADPTALVSGPVSAGWWDYFYSTKDLFSGWSTAPYKYWSNPVDRKAHGDVPIVDWYLRKMKEYEDQHDQRLLDYLDVHAYMLPDGIAFGDAGDPATQALRLQSTRVLWDPAYTFPSQDILEPVRLIPRMRESAAGNYPGTKLAITEYNFGGFGHITGALAQADAMGIFGREGLDLATLWGIPGPADPVAFAFRMFLDYDGKGGRFGDTSVPAQSAGETVLSAYAAERTDGALTLLAINKSTSDQSSAVSLAGFNPGGRPAEAYLYSAANPAAIARLEDVPVSSSGFSFTFPARSMTLFVIPAQPALNPHQPVIRAVVNAASYGKDIAPGQIVAIFGDFVGPDAPLLSPQFRNPDIISAELGSVRVFFDGLPAPVLAATASQVNAVAPYAAATRAAVHIQIEFQGRRSDVLEIPVVTAAPGLFTADASGQGPAAALNIDRFTGAVTLHGRDHPAREGDWVSLFLTGEGLTDPPGVDGRVATNILAKPRLPVKVKIGGLDADSNYAGAAPGFVAGLLQVNAKIPPGLKSSQATVQVTIGQAATQPGVTLWIE